MIIVDDITGNMTLYQGDSDYYTLEDMPTDQEYTAYMSFYDSNRKPIGEELDSKLEGSPICTFFIPSSQTDLFKVPKDEETAEYYFGVKLCHTDDEGNKIETTVLIGNSNMGDLNTITVYPKKTEGTL